MNTHIVTDTNAKHPIRIVVLQRSWNLVGRFSENNGVFTIHEPCFVIRRWGTTAGLGQIAEDGPTKDTILDKTPTVRGHQDALIFTIDCNQEKWEGLL